MKIDPQKIAHAFVTQGPWTAAAGVAEIILAKAMNEFGNRLDQSLGAGLAAPQSSRAKPRSQKNNGRRIDCKSERPVHFATRPPLIIDAEIIP